MYPGVEQSLGPETRHAVGEQAPPDAGFCHTLAINVSAEVVAKAAVTASTNAKIEKIILSFFITINS